MRNQFIITNLTYQRLELLVRAECVRTNFVRALADVVATKLGIILSFLQLTFLPEGVCIPFLVTKK